MIRDRVREARFGHQSYAYRKTSNSALSNKSITYFIIHLTLSLFSDWPIFEISSRDVITADYTIIMSRSRVIMSCMTAVHDFQG